MWLSNPISSQDKPPALTAWSTWPKNCTSTSHSTTLYWQCHRNWKTTTLLSGCEGARYIRLIQLNKLKSNIAVLPSALRRFMRRHAHWPPRFHHPHHFVFLLGCLLLQFLHCLLYGTDCIVYLYVEGWRHGLKVDLWLFAPSFVAGRVHIRLLARVFETVHTLTNQLLLVLVSLLTGS